MHRYVLAGLSAALSICLASPAAAWVKFSGQTGPELGLDESVAPFGTPIQIRYFPPGSPFVLGSLDVVLGVQTFSTSFAFAQSFDNLGGVDRLILQANDAIQSPSLDPKYALFLRLDYADTTWSGTPPSDLFTNVSPLFAYVSVGRVGEAGASGGAVTQGFLPEPSNWALIILGFSGVGAALRRTRRRGQPTM